MFILSSYLIGSLGTAGALYASNRATGLPVRYTVLAAAFWPLWWAGLSIDSY